MARCLCRIYSIEIELDAVKKGRNAVGLLEEIQNGGVNRGALTKNYLLRKSFVQ